MTVFIKSMVCDLQILPLKEINLFSIYAQRRLPHPPLFFFGGYAQDGSPIQGIEHHGPFEKPGKLFKYALQQGFIGIDREFMGDLKQYTRDLKAKGKDSRTILMAYDDWAFEDMSNRDWVDGAQAVIVDDEEYKEMLRTERERMERYLPEPCNHIDYPCCGCGPNPLGHAIIVSEKSTKNA